MSEKCGVKTKHPKHKDYKNMSRADKVNLQEGKELADEVREYPCLYDKASEHYSWGISYMPCLLLVITLRFTCGKTKIW